MSSCLCETRQRAPSWKANSFRDVVASFASPPQQFCSTRQVEEAALYSQNAMSRLPLLVPQRPRNAVKMPPSRPSRKHQSRCLHRRHRANLANSHIPADHYPPSNQLRLSTSRIHQMMNFRKPLLPQRKRPITPMRKWCRKSAKVAANWPWKIASPSKD